MTDQVLIKNQYTYSREIGLDNCFDSKGLRVYRDTPFTIHIQVRTHTAKKGRISGLSVSAAEARDIAEYLIRKADELRDDPGKTKQGTTV